MDQGYSDSHALIQAHDVYAMELLMPMRTDHSWQAQQANAYDLSRFHIDWETQRVVCPEGHTSDSWVRRQDKQGYLRYEVMFNTTSCTPCPRGCCVRTPSAGDES